MSLPKSPDSPIDDAGFESDTDWAELDKAPPRCVLSSAFVLLDVVARSDSVIGLTELARRAGLAKTTTHRLAEQLVAIGALERVDHRYVLGSRIALLGQQWHPDGWLWQAARAPIHTLATRMRGIMATLLILHKDRLRVVTAAAPRGHAYMPAPLDRESTARTAAGRVLYATAPPGIDLPASLSAREWIRLRTTIGDLHTTVRNQQDVVPGICCVSAPAWWPDGTCAGAVTALVYGTRLPPNLPDLVLRAARRVDTALRYPDGYRRRPEGRSG